jgi:hypothetical protein
MASMSALSSIGPAQAATDKSKQTAVRVVRTVPGRLAQQVFDPNRNPWQILGHVDARMPSGGTGDASRAGKSGGEVCLHARLK